MPSRRTLGAVALSSLGTAAVSFAVVDVTTSISRGCADAAARACAHEAIPLAAIVFTALGFAAVAVGVVPAVLWIVSSVRAAHEPSDEEADDELVADDHRRALREPDDKLLTGEVDLVDPDDEQPGRAGLGGLRRFLP
ncbi:hypothetical protein [Schumannella soli]|uniref:Uncharacterized protein n=1 Tax=Schumannella soli TaxID=2590779 RepID=A0A506Y260_9MICO|nr:hypothetical protein [Schumannella soli]TPW76062.1 hypothetical protein FJ657_09585 [Schumannella soli]